MHVLALAALIGGGYFLYRKAYGSVTQNVTAYDGVVYPIVEDHNISTTAQTSISNFLGTGGTLANSQSPAADVAQFVSYLNGLGFSTAGKSIQSTYALIAQHAAKNMQTAQTAANLTSSQAGSAVPGIFDGDQTQSIGQQAADQAGLGS